MIKINLLPVREKVKRENLKRQAGVAAGILVAFFGLIGFMTYAQQAEVSNLRDKKAQAERKLAALKKEVGDLEAVKKKKQALEKRKEAIADLNRNRHGLAKAIDELTRDKPKELYFVTLEQKSKASPWEDFTIAINGIATDNEVVAQFMRNLHNYRKTFPSVDLEFTKAKVLQKEASAYQEFQMVVQVAQEKPKPSPKPEQAKPQGKEQPKSK